jgi:hypothetical protein
MGTEKEGCMQGSSPDVTMVGSAMTLRRMATRKTSTCMACGKLTSTPGSTTATTVGLDVGSATGNNWWKTGTN